MLAFGRELGAALAAIDRTAARMGMATGAVVLTHIVHGGDALPAKYIYGDTVSAARRPSAGRILVKYWSNTGQIHRGRDDRQMLLRGR